MSKHWRPEDDAGTRWLPEADYRALSPQQRRALHFKRSLKRQAQRSTPPSSRYRNGYHARQRWRWLAAALVFGAIATQSGLRLPNFILPSMARASAPVRATF